MTMSVLQITIIGGGCLLTGVFLGLLLAVLALASSEYLDEQKKKGVTNGRSKRL